MAEPGPPPVGDAGREPRGALRHARFAGILEGRRTPDDASTLRAVAARIDGLGLAPCDLELDGGRFTLMLSEEPLPPARWRGADPARFVELLQELVDASSDPRSVESTLRCTEVYEDDVVETLFAVAGGTLRSVSRVRPAQATDRQAAARLEEPALPAVGLRQAGVLAALVLAVFGVMAWQGGWVDRLFRAELEAAAVDPGPFGDLLAVELEPRLGNYALELRRGPGYPRTTAELDALLAAAPTPADRAAVAAVGDGDGIYVQLLDGDGELLAATELGLRPLLSREDAVVDATLPGRIDARSLRLALDAGTRSE